MQTESPPVPDTAFPATVRLPPHRSLLRIGPDGRLLGLDPGVALAVDRLPGELALMLDELDRPVNSADLVARAVERGAHADTAALLLRELLRVGAIIDADVVERRSRRRGHGIVAIHGDGPLAAGVVLGLVQGGVGRVYVDTAGSVVAGDLGTGYVDRDRGHDRRTAIREAVRRVRPEVDLVAAPRGLVPDLVVLADALAPEPARLAQLHVAGTAHLPVRMRDGVGLVGPLVLPGRSACLGCIEVLRRSRAPGWAEVSAQLVGRRGAADPAATVATAALATAQVLAVLDATTGGGPAPPTFETTLELDAGAGTVVRRLWNPQAECGCGAASAHRGPPGVLHHDSATSADRPTGETIMV